MMLAATMAMLLTTAAPVDERTIGVLPVQVHGRLTRAQRKTMVSTMTALLAESADVIGPDPIVQANREARSCAEPECWRAVSESSGARYLVSLVVGKSGPDYALTLRLIDGESGKVMTGSDRACEICGFAEMNQTLAEMVRAVAARIDETAVAGLLVVTTVPEGARVRLDRRLLGTTPLELPVAPGRKALRIKKNRYIGRKQPVLMVAGTTTRVDAELQPIPRSRYRGLGWGALGGGMVAVGVGATLLALDGRPVRARCSGPNVDDDGYCPFRHSTLAGGIASVVTGGVLLGAATALLVVGYRADDDRKIRATLGPQGLRVEGRF